MWEGVEGCSVRVSENEGESFSKEGEGDEEDDVEEGDEAEEGNQEDKMEVDEA